MTPTINTPKDSETTGDGLPRDDLEYFRIAVIVPCYNEEASIAKVVQDFTTFLPEADVFVYDNNSTDQTAKLAAEAGATVKKESRPGKGNVVRRMFGDIDADIYLLIDGDDTYDIASARLMINLLLEEELDMVTGVRVSVSRKSYPAGHRFGNWFLTTLVKLLFGSDFNDLLSGYRVFSNRFVKSFPALSPGFEIETELSVHAMELRMPTGEVPTPYTDRDLGSESKLNTIPDGFRILKTIFLLVKEERPLQMFSSISAVLAALSLVLVWPVLMEYLDTGVVPRFPTAILSSAIMLLSFLSLSAGLILDTITLGRQELKRMFFLSLRSISAIKTVRIRCGTPNN